jgi:hypothetical protein
MLEPVDDVKNPASEQEKAHAKRLLKRIKSFEKMLGERAEGWKKAREYADGDTEGDGEKGLVRVNLIGSFLDTVQPSIYAKAPEIAVTLDDRIDTSEYPVYAGFAQTLQDALNVFLVKDAKLKTRGKAAVRGSLTATIGWAKVLYQVDKREDPIIRNQINDTQDNIERIKVLVEETKQEGGECADYDAKLFELNQQVEALQAKIEVVTAEGLVVDIVPAEDIIIMDASCRDVDEFMQSNEICHRIKMTVDAFKTKFGKAPPKSTKKYVSDSGDESAEVDEDDHLVSVYEVWSLKDLTVYTICEGSQQYVRPPFQPQTLGEQWYPFFGLQLRRVDGKKYPRSMVEQLIELQDEFNTRRTNASEHRKKNIPVRLLNKASGISDDEVTKIVNRSIKTDVIGVTMDANTPLQNQLGSLPEIPYNPQMYDTSDIMRDMEMVGNTQDAARGAINTAKTATEAEIMSMGMQSRTSEALDVIEDWLSEIAIYSAQLLLQKMPAALIKKRFGESAVWPELTKQELFEMVNISIRAGSTSRPNKMRERDQWLQLMPIIQQTMEKVVIAKQQGQEEIADAYIALLDETLHRFDEKLDAKELLGIGKDADSADDGGNQPTSIPPEQLAEIQKQLDQQMKGIEDKSRELDKQANEVAMERVQLEADRKVAQAESELLLERLKYAGTGLTQE